MREIDEAGLPAGWGEAGRERSGRYAHILLAGLEAEAAITPEFGHPWDQALGWMLLELRARTAASRDAAIAAFRPLHWRVWLSGTVEDEDWPFGAALYKPAGAAGDKPWRDDPDEARADR